MTPRFAVALLCTALLAACNRDAPAPAQPAIGVEARPDRAQPVDTSRPRLQVALVDGSRYDLAQHRGRWVVVNFWATWCGPCIKEMPELSTLASRGKVDVIGLAYEVIEPKAMQAFLARRKPAYPIAIVDTFNPPADFEAPPALPMTILIAPDGRVARTLPGAVTLAMIEEAIAQHPARGGA